MNTQEPTLGEKAVGLNFNPNNNAAVTTLKKSIATFIDECYVLRSVSNNPEVKRMASIAITEAQTAQMWAVKAVTWNS